MARLPRPERSYVIPGIVLTLLMKAHDALELNEARRARPFIAEALARLRRADLEQSMVLDEWARTTEAQDERRRKMDDA